MNGYKSRTGGKEGGFVSLHRRHPPPLIPVLTFFLFAKELKKALVLVEKGTVVFKKRVGLLSSKHLTLKVTLVII